VQRLFGHFVVVVVLLGCGSLIWGIIGPSNPCEELAEKVCKKVGDDFQACEAAVANPDDTQSKKKDCERLQQFSVSCENLQTKASSASTEDETACRADVELIRALEKQQQQM